MSDSIVLSAEDYEKMSDHEINVHVAAKLGVNAKCDNGLLFTSKIHDGDNVISVTTITDYCNNPSDMWPLIVKNKINVYASEGPEFMPWMAGCRSVIVSHKNPLRAAAIVFLTLDDKS